MKRANLPYSSFIIDSSLSQVRSAAAQCFTCHEHDVAEKEERLRQIWTTQSNNNLVLPCLSVRSGFDLFLQSQAYPHGSEVIMSAINIKDMAEIVRHHKLKVLSVDINIDTLEPKMNVLEMLITPRSVAILVAHLFGRRLDLAPIIALAKRYKLHVIEDCAQCFCGHSYIGHPESDIALFSFGPIKFLTSFGGGIAKVREEAVFAKMNEIHSRYSRQTNTAYLQKVLKYGIMYTLLHFWPFPQAAAKLRESGHDFKELFISYLRSFPVDLISHVRHRPSPALLSVMTDRQAIFNQDDFDVQRIKGEYVLNGLTEEMWPVGTAVRANSFWLFPVVVENTAEVFKSLTSSGVDAYRGTTQLQLIEPDDPGKPVGPNLSCGQMVPFKESYPHEAKYLMDHVIYLPVNKHVPFWGLNKMMRIFSSAMLNVSINGEACDVTKRAARVKAHFAKSKIKSKL